MGKGSDLIKNLNPHTNPIEAFGFFHDPGGLFYKSDNQNILELQGTFDVGGIGAKNRLANDALVKKKLDAWGQDVKDSQKADRQLKKEEQMETSLLASANNSMENVRNREQIKKLGN